MIPKDHGLRKAAILVASLDASSAGRLLEQMDPAQARQVRDAIAHLGPIDQREQQEIIEEFFRVKPVVPPKHPPGIELDGQLAQQLAAGNTVLAEKRVGEATGAEAQSIPFRFLREAEVEKLALALANERPQTVALVLAHLPPEQAGGVLVRLAPPLQVEVIRRLANLEETDPEVLQEVERALLTRLSQQVAMHRRCVAGVPAVQRIMEASEPAVAMQLLRNLHAHDHRLAERLGRRPLEFDDLERLDGPALAAIAEAADREILALALVGALPALVERILRQLPEAEASSIRRRIEHVGPIRLADVEEARRLIAQLAEDLAIQRRIALPRSLRPLRLAA